VLIIVNIAANVKYGYNIAIVTRDTKNCDPYSKISVIVDYI